MEPLPPTSPRAALRKSSPSGPRGPDGELFRNAALELLGGVEAAPRARAFASGVLTSWRFPSDLHDLGVLATSELVANSLQHGTPPMRLRLRRTDRRLIIEVTDGDDHLPRRRRAEPADEAGRGIAIVATIASGWGSRRTPGRRQGGLVRVRPTPRRRLTPCPGCVFSENRRRLPPR